MNPGEEMIARLADLREFSELKAFFAEKSEADVKRLARKTFASPEEHDRIEWEKLRAYYKGIDDLLALPIKLRDQKRKEQSERSSS